MSQRQLSAVAALIADPSRAAMLDALMDGEERPAGALAALAGVSPQTASSHLRKLREGGLVTAAREGREHRFRLAGDDVAEAIETLLALAPAPSPRGLREVTAAEAMVRARTCYDHLAGRLGVELTIGLRREGVIAGRELRVTRHGERRIGELGIDVDALRAQRRPLTRPCLDVTERQAHIGGALGAALAAHALRHRWVRRLPGSRALRLTSAGAGALHERGWVLAGRERAEA